MATVRVKNVSGVDREVPLPGGGYVVVPANHSHEFESAHARSLIQQEEVWQKYESRSTETPSKADKKDGA